MFKQKLFQQLSEQIHSYAYGDSVHVRYIVLYTSFDNLIVIAEDKYKLTVSIETLKWKKDSIITMKYYSCALHILTITGEYIEIVLANLFQVNKQKDDSLMQTILLHDALLPNNMKLKDVYLIKSFSDFVIMTKSKNKIAFISQSGQILFYNSEIKTITQIIALRQTLQYSQTIEIDQKEQIIGITEFNDLITFSDTDQEPQIHRFADPNYSIVQIYFVGNENILILQENKKEQRFVKYKLKKLKYVKKYYYLPKDDCEYKFVEIHELPKIFLALVFKQTQYEIISLSKKVLQERLQKNIAFKFQNIFEENKQILDFQKIFYCPDTTLLNTKEIHNQVIHFSKYNQQFRTKLTKKQLNEVLKSDQSIINKEDRVSELKNIEQYCSLLITSTQIYIVQLCQEYKDELTFTKLQQLENYERTFNHIPKLTLCWQEKVIQFLWHHLNCEQGIKHYFKDKDHISEQIYKWVNSLTHNENIYQKLENLQNTQIIYIENQYDKCLSTIALLNFKNLSNEISISRIVSMVFNRSLDYCNQIVTDNSNTFLQLIQFIKSNSNPVLCYNYWKNSQQLLFILINILEVWLTYCMHKYDVTLIKAQEFFEPQFLNKIRSLIVSCKVPISLRLKLILFLQDYQYVKLFTLGIQQIENKQELINFSQICNITNDFPSFNIYSIQHLLDECDILYIKNLIQISGNQGIQNDIDQSKPKNPSFGLIIQSILTGQSNNIEICKIINWFLS